MSYSYTIDTNIIVTLNREQPRDIYASVWGALEALIADRRCFMNREAFEELKDVDDECAPWAKAQEGFVQETTEGELAVVGAIPRSIPAGCRKRRTRPARSSLHKHLSKNASW